MRLIDDLDEVQDVQEISGMKANLCWSEENDHYLMHCVLSVRPDGVAADNDVHLEYSGRYADMAGAKERWNRACALAASLGFVQLSKLRDIGIGKCEISRGDEWCMPFGTAEPVKED